MSKRIGVTEQTLAPVEPRHLAHLPNFGNPGGSAFAIQVSEDIGAAAARRLGGGSDDDQPVISGRGPGAAADSPEEAAPDNRAGSGVELGLCNRSTGGRKKV